MTDALAATFVNIRPVMGRRVTQLVFEVKTEDSDKALSLLGFPRPDNPQWVGIAPLALAPDAGTTTERQKVEQHRLVKLAAVLCGDERFKRWMGLHIGDADHMAEILRSHLGIASRRELATNQDAAAKFEALVARFRQETGQMAEVRP